MRGALTLALAALLGARSTQRAPSEWMSLRPAGRDLAIEAVLPLPLPLRIEQMSGNFLGTPYVFSPLGEGSGKDPDPIIRFDAVDCLTFVETSIALSVAASPADVAPMLTEIRYAQTPTYEDRNHLMEAEWLPHNLAKGFLVDVTRQVAGTDAVEVEKVLTKQTWKSKSSVALDLPSPRHLEGRFPLWIVPLAKALAHARAAPTGTVAVVVREDRPYLVTRVSHLGFLVQKQGRPYLRHASNTFGRVVDEDLESFLKRNARYERWKVAGLSLYQVKAPR